MSFFRKFQDPAESALQTAVNNAKTDDPLCHKVEVQRILRAPTFLTGLASSTAAYTDYIVNRLGQIVHLACPSHEEAVAMKAGEFELTMFWSSRADDSHAALQALTTSNSRISDAVFLPPRQKPPGGKQMKSMMSSSSNPLSLSESARSSIDDIDEDDDDLHHHHHHHHHHHNNNDVDGTSSSSSDDDDETAQQPVAMKLAKIITYWAHREDVVTEKRHRSEQDDRHLLFGEEDGGNSSSASASSPTMDADVAALVAKSDDSAKNTSENSNATPTADSSSSQVSASARHALRILATAIKQTSLQDPTDNNNNDDETAGTSTSFNKTEEQQPINNFNRLNHLVRPRTSSVMMMVANDDDSSNNKDNDSTILQPALLDVVAGAAVKAATRKLPEASTLLSEMIQRSPASCDAVCENFRRHLTAALATERNNSNSSDHPSPVSNDSLLFGPGSSSGATKTKLSHVGYKILTCAFETAHQLVSEVSPQAKAAACIARFLALVLHSAESLDPYAPSVDDIALQKTFVGWSVDTVVGDKLWYKRPWLQAMTNFLSHKEVLGGTSDILLSTGVVLPSSVVSSHSSSASSSFVGGSNEDNTSAACRSFPSSDVGGVGGSSSLTWASLVEEFCSKKGTTKSPASATTSNINNINSNTRWSILLKSVHTALASLVRSPEVLSVLANSDSNDDDLGWSFRVRKCLVAIKIACVYLNVTSQVCYAHSCNLKRAKMLSGDNNNSNHNNNSANDSSTTIDLFGSPSSTPTTSLPTITSSSSSSSSSSMMLVDAQFWSNAVIPLCNAVWALPDHFRACSVLHNFILVFAVQVARCANEFFLCYVKNFLSATPEGGSAAYEKGISDAFANLLPVLEKYFAIPSANSTNTKDDVPLSSSSSSPLSPQEKEAQAVIAQYRRRKQKIQQAETAEVRVLCQQLFTVLLQTPIFSSSSSSASSSSSQSHRPPPNISSSGDIDLFAPPTSSSPPSSPAESGSNNTNNKTATSIATHFIRNILPDVLEAVKTASSSSSACGTKSAASSAAAEGLLLSSPPNTTTSALPTSAEAKVTILKKIKPEHIASSTDAHSNMKNLLRCALMKYHTGAEDDSLNTLTGCDGGLSELDVSSSSSSSSDSLRLTAFEQPTGEKIKVADRSAFPSSSSSTNSSTADMMMAMPDLSILDAGSPIIAQEDSTSHFVVAVEEVSKDEAIRRHEMQMRRTGNTLHRPLIRVPKQTAEVRRAREERSLMMMEGGSSSSSSSGGDRLLLDGSTHARQSPAASEEDGEGGLSFEPTPSPVSPHRPPSSTGDKDSSEKSSSFPVAVDDDDDDGDEKKSGDETAKEEQKKKPTSAYDMDFFAIITGTDGANKEETNQHRRHADPTADDLAVRKSLQQQEEEKEKERRKKLLLDDIFDQPKHEVVMTKSEKSSAHNNNNGVADSAASHHDDIDDGISPICVLSDTPTPPPATPSPTAGIVATSSSTLPNKNVSLDDLFGSPTTATTSQQQDDKQQQKKPTSLSKEDLVDLFASPPKKDLDPQPSSTAAAETVNNNDSWKDDIVGAYNKSGGVSPAQERSNSDSSSSSSSSSSDDDFKLPPRPVPKKSGVDLFSSPDSSNTDDNAKRSKSDDLFLFGSPKTQVEATKKQTTDDERTAASAAMVDLFSSPTTTTAPVLQRKQQVGLEVVTEEEADLFKSPKAVRDDEPDDDIKLGQHEKVPSASESSASEMTKKQDEPPATAAAVNLFDVADSQKTDVSQDSQQEQPTSEAPARPNVVVIDDDDPYVDDAPSKYSSPSKGAAAATADSASTQQPAVDLFSSAPATEATQEEKNPPSESQRQQQQNQQQQSVDLFSAAKVDKIEENDEPQPSTTDLFAAPQQHEQQKEEAVKAESSSSSSSTSSASVDLFAGGGSSIPQSSCSATATPSLFDDDDRKSASPPPKKTEKSASSLFQLVKQRQTGGEGGGGGGTAGASITPAALQEALAKDKMMMMMMPHQNDKDDHDHDHHHGMTRGSNSHSSKPKVVSQNPLAFVSKKTFEEAFSSKRARLGDVVSISGGGGGNGRGKPGGEDKKSMDNNRDGVQQQFDWSVGKEDFKKSSNSDNNGSAVSSAGPTAESVFESGGSAGRSNEVHPFSVFM